MKNKIAIGLLSSLILLVVMVVTSYAYFTARIEGAENETSLTISGGTLNINYSSSNNIYLRDVFPKEEALDTKVFTLTGNNTTNLDMEYHVNLVVTENTFINSELKYTVTSTKDNGETFTSENLNGIREGSNTIFLGNGKFIGNVTNKLHTYTLKIYLPRGDELSNENQGKSFKAYIEIKEKQGSDYLFAYEKGVNKPVLSSGMTPIKWDSSFTEIETTETDPDWYDYNNKKWANAKTEDGSYWVWIPRYAYKIETCYHMSGAECEASTGKTSGDVSVKFLTGLSNESQDNTKIESIGYQAGVKDTSMHYFLHPAFMFDGDKPGFWISKFDSSHIDGEIKIAPFLKGYFWTTFDETFMLARSMETKTSLYGWNPSEVDTHASKNTEWGALAYLTKSEFGAHNDPVWPNRGGGGIPGCVAESADTTEPDNCYSNYNSVNGVKGSSTHTIYGIYDLNGGYKEFTISYSDDLKGTEAYYGAPSAAGSMTPIIYGADEKYKTRYIYKEKTNGPTPSSQEQNKNIYGDAIYETSSVIEGNNAWGNAKNGYPTPDYLSIYIFRGGHFYDETTGIFDREVGNMRYFDKINVRVVVMPKQY